jgi:hypothetical protein
MKLIQATENCTINLYSCSFVLPASCFKQMIQFKFKNFLFSNSWGNINTVKKVQYCDMLRRWKRCYSNVAVTVA